MCYSILFHVIMSCVRVKARQKLNSLSMLDKYRSIKILRIYL